MSTGCGIRGCAKVNAGGYTVVFWEVCYAYQPLGMMDKMMLLEQGRALARNRGDFYG